MKALFRYPGSKFGIANWIISHFPEGYEKMVYVEPFAGSAAVFFNKNPGTVETINDLYSDIVNLYQILREKPDELKRLLSLTPYSREEYDLSFEPCEDAIEKARRFMVRTTQAIGAKLDGKCGWRNHKLVRISGTACKWNGITDTIDIAAARLKGNTTNLVQIEHTDAFKLIERYNSSNVLMYLDPPYLKQTRKSGRLYQYEMDIEQHIHLLNLVKKSKAKIVLSGYPSELYNTQLKGWYKETTKSQITSGDIAQEVIWLNYEPYRQIRFTV